MQSIFNRPKQTRFLERLQEFKRIRELFLDMGNSAGTTFEINDGCPGGDDATIFARILKKSRATFLEHLKGKQSPFKKFLGVDFFKIQKNNEKTANEFEKTFFEIEKYESTKFDAKNLFAESMERKADALINQAKATGKKDIVVVVADAKYIDPNEEDFKLAQLITQKTGKLCLALSIEEYLDRIKNGYLDPTNIFAYNDLTPEDIDEYYKQDPEYAKKIISEIESFDCNDLKIGREWIKNLTISTENLRLANSPITSSQLEILGVDNPNIDYDKYILKIDPSYGGTGIFNYDEKAQIDDKKYFSKERLKMFLKEMKTRPEMSVTLDLKSKLPTTMQSAEKYEEIDENGLKVYKIKSAEKLKPYTVDTRVTVTYDPVTGILKPIGLYGRFNHPGEKSNIAQGGGVVEVKIVQDDKIKYLQRKITKLMTRLIQTGENTNYLNLIQENMTEEGFSEKGNPVPFAPFPFLISESSFTEILKVCRAVGEGIENNRLGKNNTKAGKPILFAIDVAVNPIMPTK